MNSSSFRRLAKDHAALHNRELPPYYLFPPNAATGGIPDDLTQLTIFLAGPKGTPYADGVWKLHLKIPQDYPKSPPKAFFKTKIWHPNVEESNGSVCLDTLKRDWESKLTLRDILITISCLLINPNPDSALNAAAGKLLQEDWESFAVHARLMTSIHAAVPSNLRKAVTEAQSRGEETASNEEAEEQPSDENAAPALSVITYQPLPHAHPPPAPLAIEEDRAAEDSEDEEENTKENDASLSPSPVDPNPPPTIRRPTILGKRPLGELPTPVEPPSDDEFECDPNATNSARNIVANNNNNNSKVNNTPNLSQGITNLSFEARTPSLTTASSSRSSSASSSAWPTPTLAPPRRCSPKLAERVHGTNFASSSSSSSTFFHSSSSSSSLLQGRTIFGSVRTFSAGPGLGLSGAALGSCGDDGGDDSSIFQPRAKRLCSDDFKENSTVATGMGHARVASASQPKPTPLIGLGVRALGGGSSSAPASRKGSALGGGVGAGAGRSRARVGMRRL